MLRDRFRLILVLVALLAVPATVVLGAAGRPRRTPSDPFFDDTDRSRHQAARSTPRTGSR